jgi:hypothetical protein
MFQVKQPYFQNALDVGKSCMQVLSDLGLLRGKVPLPYFSRRG